jgi:signal recognition particle receptor subunit beta
LTSLPPSQTAPALLIAAHKADLIKATTGGQSPSQLAINRVRSVLERELERRRVAQAGGVSVEGTGSEEALGGLDCAPGQPFRFADWEGGVVAFLGSWTTPGSQTAKAEEAGEKVPTDGLTDFRAWLEEL